MLRYAGAVVAVMVYLVGGASAGAQKGAVANPACPNENAQISVNFNGADKDVSTVKSVLDAKIAEVKTMADSLHLTKFEIQSYNYNVNANYNGGPNGDAQFQYNGNATFSVLPADKALDLMSALAKKGYRVSVNVNNYNNMSCGRALRPSD